MFKGYLRVLCGKTKSNFADINGCTREILDCLDKVTDDIDIVFYPELTLGGISSFDLYKMRDYIECIENSIQTILEKTVNKKNILVFGTAVRIDNELYDVLMIMQSGKILGIVPRTDLIENGNVFGNLNFSAGEHSVKVVNYLSKRVAFGADLILVDPAFDNVVISFCIGKESLLSRSVKSESFRRSNVILFTGNMFNVSNSENDFENNILSFTKNNFNSVVVNLKGSFSNKNKLKDRYDFINSESTGEGVYSSDCFLSEYNQIIRNSFLDDYIFDVDIDRLDLNNGKQRDIHLSSSVGNLSELPGGGFRAWEVKVNFSHQEFKLKRYYSHLPFINEVEEVGFSNILENMAISLAARIKHLGINNIQIGISGGLDSTLSVIVAKRAFEILDYDLKNLHCITMPGLGTGNRTKNNALKLMELLEVKYEEISIVNSVKVHLQSIGIDVDSSNIDKNSLLTIENAQARERTQLLMNIANKNKGFVLGTGDMSEIALGWATYNGDHMSMYSVNAGVPKTVCKYLVQQYAHSINNDELKSVLLDIVDTPISPELIPSKEELNQKTEDNVGPYDLQDFRLYYLLKYGYSKEKIDYLIKNAFKDFYSDDEIEKWGQLFYKRFITQQYKRNAMPEGPNIFGISLSPRGAYTLSSDAYYFYV